MKNAPEKTATQGKKTTYHSPRFFDYGDVRKLTLGNQNGSIGDGGRIPNTRTA